MSPRSIVPLLSVVASLTLPAEEDTRLVRETNPLTPSEEQTKLKVSDDFEIQLFASEPMINKPINLAFDARGRLWVSSTVEYPYSAARERWTDLQGSFVRDSRDAIKILEDTDGDGRADKVTDFADGLNIPTGVLPWHKPEHKAGCIAWSIPNIWYFADTDGDGKADLREVLFGPLGYEKDTHGMCSSFRLGLDGWVYATHGFNNTSRLEVLAERWHEPAGMTNSRMANDERNPNASSPITAASPFDIPGRRLELHSGNVFRFRPDGSAVELWSAGQVNPFGLAWDRYGNLYSADCHSSPVYQLLRGAHYPSFGKPHDGLGFAPVMCQHTHGSTGICGIVYIDGGVWGPEWDDHLFLGNVVTSRVNHDHVTFTGSTPKANEQPDFLISDDPWFRPVDLALGPDNALYIADFYNKIIGHYEVPLDHPERDRERGRIWRVVKKKAEIHSVQEPGDLATVWQLRELAQAQKFSAMDKAELIQKLRDPSPKVARMAAEVLQAHPSIECIQPLLHALNVVPEEDASLKLSLRIALRENLNQPGAFELLPPDARVMEIALAVPTAEAADFLLAHGDLTRREVQTHLARNTGAEKLPAILQALRQLKMPPTPVIEALHNGLLERGTPPPTELLNWAQTTAAGLLIKVAQQPAPDWIFVPQSNPQPNWSQRARKLADGSEIPALQSMTSGGGGAEESRTGVLRSKAFAAPAKLRFQICGHRGAPQEKPNKKNLVRLVDAKGKVLRTAFPPRSDVLKVVEWDLSVVAGQPVHLEIVDGDAGKSYAWLGIARIEPAVVKVESFTAENTTRQSLMTLATLLRTTAPVALRDQLAPYLPPSPAPPPASVSPEQRAALDLLIVARVDSFKKSTLNPGHGAAIFAAHCAACHQIGGQGGLFGPQLDGIGTRGVERLCEDILDPNRNVDAHFHLHVLTRKDGGTVTGFLKAEAGQVLILADAAGNETRVPKSDVQKDDVLPQSLMPAAFGQMIPEADFVNLLGWLLSK